MNPIDWDDTQCRIPRVARNPATPITEPAPSGFFVVDSLSAVLLQWAILLGALAVASLLVGCGPSDVQAAQAVASDVQEAQAQAVFAQQEIDRLTAALHGPRPNEISEADWALSQKALSIAQGEPK